MANPCGVLHAAPRRLGFVVHLGCSLQMRPVLEPVLMAHAVMGL